MLFDKYITNNGITNNHPSLNATMPGQPSAIWPIPTDLQSLTYHKCLVFYAYTHFGAHLLSQDSTHVRNSLVMFYSKGDQGPSPIPGCIKYIFKDNGKIQLAIWQQLPIDTADPFRHYLYFPMCLYSVELSSDLELVQPEWVLSHFAQWQFSTKYIITLPLAQVSKSHYL